MAKVSTALGAMITRMCAENSGFLLESLAAQSHGNSGVAARGTANKIVFISTIRWCAIVTHVPMSIPGASVNNGKTVPTKDSTKMPGSGRNLWKSTALARFQCRVHFHSDIDESRGNEKWAFSDVKIMPNYM